MGLHIKGRAVVKTFAHSISKTHPSSFSSRFSARFSSTLTKLALAATVTASLAVLSACSPSASDSSQPTLTTSDQDAQLFSEHKVRGTDLGLTGSKTIILTFDDGPFPGVTENVLQTLADEGVHANWFLQGNHIPGHEHLLQAIVDGGNEVGNHTWDHTGLIGLSKKSWEQVYSEIKKTDDLIAPFVKPGQNFYFRAPGGSWTVNHTGEMNQRYDLSKYIGPIDWDAGGALVKKGGAIFASADWNCWTAKVSVPMCAQGYMKEVERKQGGIVLFHDRDIRTAQMIRILIPAWKKLGYTFITLDQVPGIATHK